MCFSNYYYYCCQTNQTYDNQFSYRIARDARSSIFSLRLSLDTETLPPTQRRLWPAAIDFENGPWWGGDQYVYTNLVRIYKIVAHQPHEDRFYKQHVDCRVRVWFYKITLVLYTLTAIDTNLAEFCMLSVTPYLHRRYSTDFCFKNISYYISGVKFFMTNFPP